MTKMDYQTALSFIHGRYKFKKHPSLDIIKDLLKRLGNPQNTINAIHIAGTNGKGSTVAYLRNIFQEDHKTVGTFTSPFLIKFNERISVDGKPISDDDLVELVEKIKPIAEEMDKTIPGGGPTEFEIITAMMFLYFANHPVDIVIVEVGIGGILDSTNVFEPIVSVITTIGMDHMKLLGDTIPKIASQKAGIIKPKRPVVIGKVDSDAMKVFKDKASEIDSPLYAYESQFNTSKPVMNNNWQQSFDYEDDDNLVRNIKTSLLGFYQPHNAACAIKTYVLHQREKNEIVNNSSIIKGIANTTWPGRFERVNDQPLVVLDGAHNIDAVNEMKKLLTKDFASNEIYIIIGILADKNYMDMLNVLGSIKNAHLVLTKFEAYGSRQSVDVDEINGQIRSKNPVSVIDNWKQAIAQTAAEMSEDDMILITGSLYFISDVRKLFKLE
ncbi:bifunctional folylpolyglutamate synthase/dihydrofolate synthase [Apilactobacillus kunkeei]|uniref:bifunctional folylpolyglutamate synthase/dihydrofolate synthase n=1 Tax=Apilactobacillus kunkeei TaxID=148814 RepID=UPI001CDC7A84|nr:folylpolyglutamate synthase/dihydrofolate synthase family protein [Apilactobacillus kunkeei]